jgi:ATP-dependent DNA helicase RecQ
MNRVSSPSWHQVRAEFQNIWGYEDFRVPQGEIIRCLLARKDALVIMPTGGGKSICFQLPALLQTGLTLVVSPLVALMENQVQELCEKNLPAALLHSQLTSPQRRQVLQKLEQQKLRLLYLSPETLLSPPVWEKLIQPQLIINGIILDEAHCLVQWGDSFRSAYRRLGAVRKALLASKPAGTKISVAAFTATAEPVAQKVIQEVLELRQPEIFNLNLYRPNLNPRVQVIWTPQGRKQKLIKFIQNQKKQSGLVYVRTRRDSDNLAIWLSEKGLNTSAYHAGLDAEERREIETKWLNGTLQFVVCTNAFGMGINKPDVRWVVHFHPPSLLSEYVQEIGRAGRDGKAADLLMLVSEPTGWLDSEDKQRQEFFSNQIYQQQQEAQQLVKKLPKKGEITAVMKQFPNSANSLSLLHRDGFLKWVDPFNYVMIQGGKKSENIQEQSSQQMRKYLYTKTCRWQFLLSAFGFENELGGFCGHCDRCRR